MMASEGPIGLLPCKVYWYVWPSPAVTMGELTALLRVSGAFSQMLVFHDATLFATFGSASSEETVAVLVTVWLAVLDRMLNGYVTVKLR